LKLIFCLDPLRVSITGIGRYTYELAMGLRDSGQLDSLKFQFLLGWVDDPQSLISRYHSDEQVKAGALKSGWFRGSMYRALRSGYRAAFPTAKGLITLPHKDHIYHSPNYELPYYAGRAVSTIHDLSILRHPEYHPAIRVRYQEAMFPGLMRKGSLFITDSECSKNELLEFYPSAQGRVVSVPLGVDPMFCVREPSVIASTLAAYGLIPGSYALSVGTIEPRKNIERLIKAYAYLPSNMRSQYPLVLVGGEGWNSEHIHELIAKHSQEGWLKYLRFVPDLDMAAIYSGARVFACVSHYEGFGLPVLEAMASGIPVISSDAASLPEVGGDAVKYINPNLTEQITDALKTILDDDQNCRALSQKGLERARLFSWDRTTKETLLAYGQIS